MVQFVPCVIHDMTVSTTDETLNTNSTSISGFYNVYERHMKFVIQRYGIPVEPSAWLQTQGQLVAQILSSKRLRNDRDICLLFIFLVLNSYVLGTRIIRDFFVEVYDDTPRYSESGVDKWNALVQKCKLLLEKNITYHDIVGNKPLNARKQVFLQNLKRILID